MTNLFKNKPFLKYNAHGFDEYPLINAYRKEED